MARYLTLAVCQTGPIQRRATRPETVGRLVHLLERAAAAGADLAVFPEIALTTFFPRWSLEEGEIDPFYETEVPGPETQPLFDAARRLRIGFALGYAETRHGRRPQAALQRHGAGRPAMASSSGNTGRWHIPGSEAPEEGTTVHLERRYFEPGDLGFPVFGFAGVRVGMTLCNDRRWPETYRMLWPQRCRSRADRLQHAGGARRGAGPGPSQDVPQPSADAGRRLPEHPVGRGCREGGPRGRAGADRRLLHHRADRKRSRPWPCRSTTRSWYTAPTST